MTSALNWQAMQHFEEGYAVDYSMKQLPSVRGYLGAFRKLLREGCEVLEYGAGGGQLSSVLSTFPSVKRVVAFDYSHHILSTIAAEVVRRIAGNPDKIHMICGDLDSACFRDESFDYVFSALTFHHAERVQAPLEEVRRILKPGGLLILFERAHPDHATDAALQAALDVEFSEKKKRQYGLPTDEKITRRMMGEHEYRVREWVGFLEDARFRVRYFPVRRLHSASIVSRAARKLGLVQRMAAFAWYAQMRLSTAPRELLNIFPGRHMGNAIFIAEKPADVSHRQENERGAAWTSS